VSQSVAGAQAAEPVAPGVLPVAAPRPDREAMALVPQPPAAQEPVPGLMPQVRWVPVEKAALVVLVAPQEQPRPQVQAEPPEWVAPAEVQRPLRVEAQARAEPMEPVALPVQARQQPRAEARAPTEPTEPGVL
jgi:hypothetical protein